MPEIHIKDVGNELELESEFKRYVTDDPNLKIIITSVSGEAVFK